MKTFEDFLNEKNITLKRRYTEAHPAKTVGSSARVRNAIIEALKDGKITVDEFNEIVAQHSSAPAKWTRGNKRFFKIEEDGVSLSKYGQKILSSLVTESVNEKSFDKMLSKSKYDYDNVPSSLDLKDDERNLDEPAEMKNIKKFQKKYGTKIKVTTDNKPVGKRVTVYMEPGVADGPDEIMEPQLERHEEMMDFVKKHNLKVSIADTVKGEWTFWTRYGVDESTVTEGLNKSDVAYQLAMDYTGRTKPKITKLNKKRIQIMYGYKINPQTVIDSIKKVHPEVELKHVEWSDKMTGGGFHIFDILESNEVTEGLNKSDVAYQLAMDYTGRTKPKITKLNKKRIQIKYGYKISPQKVIDSIKTVHPEVELKHIEWSDSMTGGGFHIFDILESAITEARASAERLLKSVAKGETSSVEGIKLSKEMASCFLEWLKGSTYGKKFKDLPFEKLFTASFNWGLDRYIQKGCKDEFKALKIKAKEMKESTTYESFSEFILNETFTSILTDIARKAKNVEDFIKRVFKHEEFKSFDTPKTQKDSYDKFLNFIKSHYATVQQYESNNIEENMIYTKFANFVNESLEINEALKSSKLRGLLTMNKGNKQLLKAIYGFSKIALDKIEDHQIIDIDPKTGKKAEGLVVYYTTQEKENPYADRKETYYTDNAIIPANTILAMGMGKDVAYIEGIWDRSKRKMHYTLTTNKKRSNSDIGINKEYRGWNASGIYNVKRVIDVADAAFVINPEALPDTKGIQADRVKAKEGALAFKSDKEFKNANLARYREILQKRASKLPLDKLVMDAIDDATNVMKDGLKNQEKNRYGELIAGVGKDGRAYKLNDISNFISNLISDYERWSGYMKTIEDAEAKYGKDSREFKWEANYAQKEAQEYAKSIKDRLDKLKKRNLAW